MNRTLKLSGLIPLLLGLYAVGALATVDPYAGTFTKITTQGQLGGSYPFFSTETPDASTTITHHQDANTAFTSEGHLDGQGIADFGTLKGRLALSGPGGLSGISTASFYEHWTVNHPTLTGQPGTMTLAFDLSGTTSILDTLGQTVLSDAFASVGILVDINPNAQSNGIRVLDYSASLGSGHMQVNGVLGSPTVTLPIDFTYGQEFGVRVSLRTGAQSDNAYVYTSSNPYFEYYGGGTIDSITVDFMSTAQLSAIVLPDATLSSLVNSSPADYAPLVTGALPVPEPASLGLLFLSGLALVLRRRSRYVNH